jgi:hypothetical protein
VCVTEKGHNSEAVQVKPRTQESSSPQLLLCLSHRCVAAVSSAENAGSAPVFFSVQQSQVA